MPNPSLQPAPAVPVPGISLVVPAYNEEDVIASTIEAAIAALSDLADELEIIVVDDGSRDSTANVVRDLSRRHSYVRLVSHDRNRGYGAALATGFAAVTQEILFLTDGDKQFDVREVANFLPLLDRAELVIGYRSPRSDPWIRRLYGWAWNTLVNLIFGYTARDVDCAFKLFRTRLLHGWQLTSTGHTLSPELVVRVRQAGCRVLEVRVSHYPRITGQPKGARPAAILRALYELARLRLEVGPARPRAVPPTASIDVEGPRTPAEPHPTPP
jgi:glycosyltransferase involved in cell wall biosynthesis